MQTIKRCKNCSREIKGEPYRQNGHEYCGRTCQEYAALAAIEKAARMALIAFCFLGAFVSGPYRPAWAHEPYSGWTVPGQNKSCCNNTDCAVTRAKYERGAWWAFVASRKIWVQVPDERIVNYKTDDAEAHLCYGESYGEVYCFRPPKLGM